jgi:ankyrin repeat protein
MRTLVVALVLLASVPCTVGQSLLKAIKDNNPSMINIALKSGVKSVNAPIEDGDSPLMLAVRTGKHKAVKALLKAKVDLEAVDKEGLPLMHVAAASGSQKVLIELLTKGLDPNVRHSDGLTPLHRAVQSGSTDVVKALLNAEVPADQPTDDGKLPSQLTSDVAMLEVLKKFGRTATKSEL